MQGVEQLSAFMLPPRPSLFACAPRLRIPRPIFLFQPVNGHASFLSTLETASVLKVFDGVVALLMGRDSFGESHLSVECPDGERGAPPEARKDGAIGLIPSRAHDPLAPPIASDGSTVRVGLKDVLAGATVATTNKH